MNITAFLPVLISGTGIFLLIRLRAFFLIHPIKTARLLTAALRRRDSRRALTLALAGTLGVGNIFGVAVGLIIGGPGSLLWLLVSSVFAGIIKYSEAAITVHTASGRGMMQVVAARLSRPLATVYSAICLALAFMMGAGLQSDSLAETAYETVGLSPAVTATVLAIATLLVILGGVRKIASATEIIIPAATLIYIFLTVSVICVNSDSLGTVLSTILASAVSPAAAGGGIIALLTSRAMREGYARGILSNEAGAGTSAMAHALSDTDPVSAGLFGMCEVLFDTVILCPLTGLAILTAIPDPTAYTSAMALVTDAIAASIGAPFVSLLFLAVTAFAFSTVICWYYYGDVCRECLIQKRGRVAYTAIFLASIILGAVSGGFLTVHLTDVILTAMTLITTAVLIRTSGTVANLTRAAVNDNKSN